jgi:hypothetical protein
MNLFKLFVLRRYAGTPLFYGIKFESISGKEKVLTN